jgi:two-component system NtrC family response regulator
MLRLYPWPGNVRESVNTLEQVLMTAHDKKTLFAKDLPNHIRIQTLKKSAGQKKGL